MGKNNQAIATFSIHHDSLLLHDIGHECRWSGGDLTEVSPPAEREKAGISLPRRQP
jgi:hypothetical protein